MKLYSPITLVMVSIVGLGIFFIRIFTMLVIMALLTTVMTGPLVTLFGKRVRLIERNRTEANADHA